MTTENAARPMTVKQAIFFTALGAALLLGPAAVIAEYVPRTTPVVERDTDCVARQFVENGYRITDTRKLLNEGSVTGAQRGGGTIKVAYGEQTPPTVDVGLHSALDMQAHQPLLQAISQNCLKTVNLASTR